MKTDTSETGLETLIVAAMTGGAPMSGEAIGEAVARLPNESDEPQAPDEVEVVDEIEPVLSETEEEEANL